MSTKLTHRSTVLTNREKEVLSVIFEGLTAKEAAEKLFITSRTVSFHLANAYRKLGVTNKMAARQAILDRKLYRQASKDSEKSNSGH